MTPYQAIYVQAPLSHIHYIPGSSSIAAIDQWGHSREATLRILEEHLTMAQNRMKQMADKHRSEREFNIGDWVYLKLQPYKQNSVQCRSNMKLSPRFYCPFQVPRQMGQVAYHLVLPTHSRIHPVSCFSAQKEAWQWCGPSTLFTSCRWWWDTCSSACSPIAQAIWSSIRVNQLHKFLFSGLIAFLKMPLGSSIRISKLNFLTLSLVHKAQFKGVAMIRSLIWMEGRRGYTVRNIWGVIIFLFSFFPFFPFLLRI